MSRRRTTGAILVLATAAFLSGCSSSSTSLSAPTPSPAPAPTSRPAVVVTGHVLATNGGQPLGGVSVRVGSTNGLTDTAGMFQATFQIQEQGNSVLLLGASHIVPRSLLIATTSTREVSVDAIALGGAFDLNFYREIVRNGFEAPSTLEPLRRWIRTPNIYLKTVDEAGEAIHGPTLDLIEATAKDAVPRWTSNVLGTPIVERGTGSREGQSGWLTIKFPAEQATTYCGRAQVAVDGGWIELSYHVPPSAPINCRVPGAVIAPHIVRHEIGHALGFWHTDTIADLMWGGQWSDPNQQPSARELYHAAIAYRRPIGNVDPDTDGASTVNLAPMTVR